MAVKYIVEIVFVEAVVKEVDSACIEKLVDIELEAAVEGVGPAQMVRAMMEEVVGLINTVIESAVGHIEFAA